MGSGAISIHGERLQISETGRKQTSQMKSFLSRQHALVHNLE